MTRDSTSRGFELGPAGAPTVLLLHGLTGAPSEVWPLGAALAEAGFRAVGPALAGHGTRPEELALVGGVEVRASAVTALDRLGPGRHLVCGLSMGALLGLGLAVERAASVRGFVALAPVLRPRGATRLLVDAVGRLPLPAWPALLVSKSTSAPREGAYGKIPLRWGRELRLLIARAERDAARLEAPLLALHGLADDTASPEGSLVLARLARSRERRVRLFPGAGHVLPLTAQAPLVFEEVVRFARATLR